MRSTTTTSFGGLFPAATIAHAISTRRRERYNFGEGKNSHLPEEEGQMAENLIRGRIKNLCYMATIKRTIIDNLESRINIPTHFNPLAIILFRGISCRDKQLQARYISLSYSRIMPICFSTI